MSQHGLTEPTEASDLTDTYARKRYGVRVSARFPSMQTPPPPSLALTHYMSRHAEAALAGIRTRWFLPSPFFPMVPPLLPPH
jgi:hypothetical protein